MTVMNETRRRRLKEALGSVAATVLAVVIVLVAIVMFLLRLGVEFAFLGSLWNFVTGDLRTGFILLGIAVVASWFFFGN